MEKQYPKTGIAVMIIKDGKTIIGKRKNSYGAGQYAFPGGHLEYMESFEECARRETREETGMEIKNIRFLRLLNFKFDGKHFTDIGFVADWKSGEAQLLEPDKCEGWEWRAIDNLPSPLFWPLNTLLEAFKTGKNYFDN